MADQGVNSLLTGLSDSLNKYMGMSIQNNMEQQKERRTAQTQLNLKTAEAGLDLSKSQALELYKQTLQGVVDPETAAKISPTHAAVIQKWMEANGGKMPPTNVADKLFDDISKEGTKTAKADDIRLTQWDRILSTDREFTNSRMKRDNLENVGGLLKQVSEQGEGPDRRQMYEQAVAQMRVLAQNGALSEKEIEHLLPSTFRGKVAQGLEWITNHPQSTEAQDFLKRGQDFFERESKITKDQMDRRFHQLSTPYTEILDRHQEVAGQTYQQYGVNHKKYNPAPKEEAKPVVKKTKDDPLGLGI